MTVGNVAGVKMAETLLAKGDKYHCALADKGYDSDPLRKAVPDKGAKPVIPGPELTQAEDPFR